MKRMLLLSTMTVVACANPTQPSENVYVLIQPNQASYSPLDTVTVMIRNLTDTDIVVGLCGSTIEIFRNGNWTTFPPADRNCPSTGIDMPTGASGSFTIGTLPANLGAGIYRYRVGQVILDYNHSPREASENAHNTAPFVVDRSAAFLQ